jgi:hypothetical protein
MSESNDSPPESTLIDLSEVRARREAEAAEQRRLAEIRETERRRKHRKRPEDYMRLAYDTWEREHDPARIRLWLIRGGKSGPTLQELKRVRLSMPELVTLLGVLELSAQRPRRVSIAAAAQLLEMDKANLRRAVRRLAAARFVVNVAPASARSLNLRVNPFVEQWDWGVLRRLRSAETGPYNPNS